MATTQAYTCKNRIYNGTNGNLSVQSGKLKKFKGNKGDIVELFHLGIGVRLIQVKLFAQKAFTGGTLNVKLVNAKDDSELALPVQAADLSNAGVFDSDTSFFFPVFPDPQVETKVVIEIEANVAGDKDLGYEIYTQSVGVA